MFLRYFVGDLAEGYLLLQTHIVLQGNQTYDTKRLYLYRRNVKWILIQTTGLIDDTQQRLALDTPAKKQRKKRKDTCSDSAALAGSAVKCAAGSPPDAATRRPRNPHRKKIREGA